MIKGRAASLKPSVVTSLTDDDGFERCCHENELSDLNRKKKKWNPNVVESNDCS